MPEDRQELSCMYLAHHELESSQFVVIVIRHTWSLGSVSRSKAAFPESSFHRSGTGSGPAVHITLKQIATAIKKLEPQY